MKTELPPLMWGVEAKDCRALMKPFIVLPKPNIIASQKTEFHVLRNCKVIRISLFIAVRSRTLLQFSEDTVENDHHYEESNTSDIVLSKLSSLSIQDDRAHENELERTLMDKTVPKNLKNNARSEYPANENYQSVIEINEKDFRGKWRTSYSDEM